MSDIEEKIDELFDDFEESKLYKDYLSVQDKISKDKEIISVINEIKKFQKIRRKEVFTLLCARFS